MITYIYYAHLASVRFEQSVCRGYIYDICEQYADDIATYSF